MNAIDAVFDAVSVLPDEIHVSQDGYIVGVVVVRDGFYCAVSIDTMTGWSDDRLARIPVMIDRSFALRRQR